MLFFVISGKVEVDYTNDGMRLDCVGSLGEEM